MLLLLIIPLLLMGLGSSRGSTVSSCHDDERQALLAFKAVMAVDQSSSSEDCERPYAKTNTWRRSERSNNCCQWDGVTCDPSSGHVTQLDLSCSQLSGAFPSNSTLFHLRHLRRLNLASNFFKYSSLPSGIGRLSDLTYLNLSYSGFGGHVPKEIGWLSSLTTLDLSSSFDITMPNFKTIFTNLTNLRDLDLSSNSFITMPNFKTIITNLTNLRDLDLSNVMLNSTIPPTIANLSHLESLNLESCEMQGHFLVTSILDMPNLRVLNLGYNYDLQIAFSTSKVMQWRAPLETIQLSGCNFITPLPFSVETSSSSNFSLRSIGISNCGIYGSVPSWIWNVTDTVDASNNHFSGSLSTAGANKATLARVATIDLSSNNITGEIPVWLYALQSLKVLNLENNMLKGTILLSKFHNLTNLDTIILSNNRLSITDDWGTNSTSFKPRLQILLLSSCNLDQFPSILRGQHNLGMLDLSNNHIGGLVPKWFLNVNTSSSLDLDLSRNSLTGCLDHLPQTMGHVDISFNKFKCHLPILPLIIDGFIASHNRFFGEFPSSLCQSMITSVLDLSYNKLTGKIPSCFSQLMSSAYDLMIVIPSGNGLIIDIRQNQLEGVIPSTIFETTCSLAILSLSGNLFEGKIPHSLINCTQLQLVDLGNNKLNDTFPQWLAALPNLKVLMLGSNKLHGFLQASSNLTEAFSSLQILDISNNEFIGELPGGLLTSFKVMVDDNNYDMASWILGNNYYSYQASISAWLKGLSEKIPHIFKGFVLIDVSKNRLQGHIPEAIGDLVSLRSLNLAHNNFTGNIPPSLGNLRQLEALDLSFNRLDGHIPNTLGNLNFLGFFNVSENNLEGSVPTSNHFDTSFLDDSYLGNPRVCGEFLTNKCGKKDKPAESIDFEKSSIFHEWEIILVGLGCGFFVGCVWGYFIFWKSNYRWAIRLIFEIEVFVAQNEKRWLRKRRC